MPEYVLAFDIYGTLLDTSSISQALSDHLQLDKDKASQVSNLWRRYQLEYTWRLNSMNLYEPFDIVTQKSLQHALKESGIGFNEDSVKKLMEAYNILPCFANTKPALEKLANAPNVEIIVFSNGTQSMVQTALQEAGLSNLVPGVFVADAVQKYKPSPEMYQGLLKAVGKEDRPEEVFLVSGNPFDVTGALSQGLRAIWVDRAKKGWTDGLLPFHDKKNDKELGVEKIKVVNDLDEVPGFVASLG